MSSSEDAAAVQRQLAQGALSASEERFRRILDSIPAFAWYAGPDGKIEYLNQRILDYTGEHLEALAGFGWANVLHSQDVERTTKAWLHSIETGEPCDIDQRVRRFDNTYRWFRTIAQPLRDHRGRVIRWYGVATDIEDLKRAEEALREREHNLRLVVDSIPGLVCTMNAAGELQLFNRQILEYLGKTPEELGSSATSDVIHPDDLPGTIAAVRSSIKTGHPYDHENRCRRADGVYRWFQVRALPVRDTEGRVIRWYCLCIDIEDRKQAEEKLRRSEASLLHAQQISRTGSWRHDFSAGTVTVSPEVYRIFGLKPDEVTSNTELWLNAIHPEDRKRTQDLFESSKIEKTDFQADYRIVLPDGGIKHLHSIGHPVLNGSGRLVEFFGTTMDVTEHQHLKRELQHERDRLRLLLDLNNRVALHLDLRQLFHAISSELRRVFNCDFVGLALPERDGKQLRQHMVEFPGGKGLFKEGTLYPIEGSASGLAFRRAKPVVLNSLAELRANWSSVAAQAFYKRATEEGLESGCYLPLSSGGQVLGILQLVSRRERSFAEQDVEFLDQVANQVAITLKNALEYEQVTETKERLAEQKLYLEDQIRVEHNFEEIIGNSRRLKTVLESVRTVAPAESTVLIQGETGTGKEMIARAIHNLSPRKGQAFVKVNCAAIPLGLLESELFGHEKGSFTGAIAQKIGRFELAHKGTLFLDEVGDIPLELQPKLLRVLQEQEFERLGSTRTQRVDVRLLAATNASLAQMVAEKKFRSDLYYRLNVFPINVPPLRERREDIPLLVRYFANKFARRMGKQIESIPKETMDALSRYAWPGNIRELQNLMERAALLSTGPSLRVPLAEVLTNAELSGVSGGNVLEQAERELIVRALRESNWVVGGAGGAAARLGLKRTALAYKMQKLGISRPQQ